MTIRPNRAQLLSRYLRRLEEAKPDTFSRLIPTKNDYCPNEGTLVRIGGISHHTLLGLPFVLLNLTWQTSLKSHFIISISTHQFLASDEIQTQILFVSISAHQLLGPTVFLLTLYEKIQIPFQSQRRIWIRNIIH